MLTSRWRQSILTWVVVVGLFSGWLVSAPKAAAAPAAGTAEILEVNGVTPLSVGGSRTAFDLRLPPHAACPGDTAHKFYLIDSYMVPVAVSPATIRYVGGEPFADRGSSLGGGGEPYSETNTEIVTGRIPNPPTLDWAAMVHHPEYLGTYNIGVSCVNHSGSTVSYWNAVVTFTASSADPGGFTWTVSQAASGHKSGSSATSWVLTTAILVVVGGAVALVVLRRRRDSTAPSLS